MKIGKYELPIYFNREFLKFNPFLFLIKEYDHILFWVSMPIVGLILKFLGGLFDFAGTHGMAVNGGAIIDGILNFMRGETWIDNQIDIFIYNVIFPLLDVDKGSGVALLFSYVAVCLMMYIKLMIPYYLFSKTVLIFFTSKENLTYEKMVENKKWQLKEQKTLVLSRSEKDEIIQDSWNLIQLLKRC